MIAIFVPETKTWQQANFEQGARYIAKEHIDQVGMCDGLPAIDLSDEDVTLEDLSSVTVWGMVYLGQHGGGWCEVTFSSGSPEKIDDLVPPHIIAAILLQTAYGLRRGYAYGYRWV